ncbi:MAG: thiazole synthase [Planctomycetes bacterium TMED75]|nr:thiazole synthase [Planctomycetaceae bacterium]OUU90832.1 MAG: thiazole synthase [Planctomycetes bacterium TMED75]
MTKTIKPDTTPVPGLQIGGRTLASRLVVGTGKYENYDVMCEAIDASGADCVTVAVRRERLVDSEGRSLLDFLDTDRITILPNTAGCFTAEDAVRVSRLGRELLDQLGNPGRDWVKLEVLGDKTTLLPDPVGTLEACRELVADGFQVLCYASDDPRLAVALRDAGAASVMPAGSPIGSGRGVNNPHAIALLLELLKDPAQGGDPDYPVIVDAGVGTPSDVTIAMELGADGVLLNTGIAHAKDPVRMAHAMRLALESGYHGARSGRISMRRYASASSPFDGVISTIPGE